MKRNDPHSSANGTDLKLIRIKVEKHRLGWYRKKSALILMKCVTLSRINYRSNYTTLILGKCRISQYKYNYIRINLSVVCKETRAIVCELEYNVFLVYLKFHTCTLLHCVFTPIIFMRRVDYEHRIARQKIDVFPGTRLASIREIREQVWTVRNR